MTLGRSRWVPLALLLLAAAVHGRTVAYPFLRFDDTSFLVDNPAVSGGLSWASLRYAFTAGHDAGWIPLTWLTRLLDVSLFGMDARGHHAVNVALHLANVLLCFRFLKEATGRYWESAFAAALFAAHPLHVESVAWVTERKDVLAGLFWFLSLTAYVRWTRFPSRGRYFLLLLLFFLSLSSKPTAVTLPFVLLLLDFWPLGRLRLPGGGEPLPWDGPPPPVEGGAAGAGPRPLRRLLLEKAPLFALSAAASVAAVLFQTAAGAVLPEAEAFPLRARIGNAVLSYGLYLWKTVWPARLAAFYPHPDHDLPAAATASSLLLLAAVSVFAWRERGRRGWLLFGWLWFLGVLVPVIGLVQAGGKAMADRCMYLPSTGLYAIAAWGASEGVRRFRIAPRAAAAAAAILLSALSARAFVQAGQWRDTGTLFRSALAVTERNWMARYLLGSEALDAKRYGEAERQLLEAVRIWPDFPEGWNGLGVALARTGRGAEGEAAFREAARSRPGWAEPHHNLGRLYASEGRAEEAAREYGEAIRLCPSCADPRVGLAILVDGRGDAEGAIRILRKAARDLPLSPEVRNNLGVLLARAGRREEAEARFREALALRPGYEGARRNLDRLRGAAGGGAAR